MRYVRKRPLGIGRNAQVEGGDVDGLNVLLVDDLTTDGGSKLNFARGLRAAGAVVEHVLTIFYHDVFPGAADRLAQASLDIASARDLGRHFAFAGGERSFAAGSRRDRTVSGRSRGLVDAPWRTRQAVGSKLIRSLPLPIGQR